MAKKSRSSSIACCSRLLSSSRKVKCSLALLGLFILVNLIFLLTPGDKFDDYLDLIYEDANDELRPLPGLGQRGEQWTQVLSWRPRVFLYHNFLSKEECDYIIDLARPHMSKSMVVKNSNGRPTESRVRTSTSMFLRRGRDEVIRAIEQRIAEFTFIPVGHGEGIQVVHYEVGQKYDPHYDYFFDGRNFRNGGQRMATVIMYLSDVEEGGETVFPFAHVNASDLPWYNELSDCGKEGLSVKPRKGDAILFWSVKPDGTEDTLSIHGGCAVIKGSKWASTKWLHVGKVREHRRKERKKMP